jgi:fermentation-respiration switch protein FrsA (DUF1100 family)/ketosteroid isomerase-like protein
MEITMSKLIVIAILIVACTSLMAIRSSRELEIKNFLEDYFVNVDAGNWDQVEEAFAEDLYMDYSSFTGIEGANQKAKEIIANWMSFLPGFDVTTHKVYDFKVDKEDGKYLVNTKVRAHHLIDSVSEGNTWIVDGNYDIIIDKTFKGYKIISFTFNFDKTIGNNGLPKIAGERAKFNTLRMKQEQELAIINNPLIWGKPASPIANEQSNNANVKLVQSFFEAYGSNNMAGIKKVMADDVKWYIPGNHKLSGIKNGIQEVISFFKLLQKAGFKAEPMFMAANDNYVVDVHRGWSTTGNDDIDMNWVLVYEIMDGKIKQVQNFSADAHQADTFFNKIYNFTDTQAIRGEIIPTERVSFTSNGVELVGTLFKPVTYDANKLYKAVVVTGSWTTVKEQMSGLYAEKLANEGFLALAYDPQGYGASEGSPRFYESPELKKENIDSAVAFLKARSDVSSIGALGICAGASYTLVSASENNDINAVVTVASWIHDAEAVKLFYGGEEGVQGKINQAKAAKNLYIETGEIEYIKAISTEDPSAAMYGAFDYYLNPKRGAVPQWSNDKFAVMSWQDWLEYDPRSTAKKLTKPTLMIHSDGAVLPEYTKKYFNDIKTDDKKLIWVETDLSSPMHQFKFYDNPKDVNMAISKARDWFNSKLK